jgi:hypothetical protein
LLRLSLKEHNVPRVPGRVTKFISDRLCRARIYLRTLREIKKGTAGGTSVVVGVE